MCDLRADIRLQCSHSERAPGERSVSDFRAWCASSDAPGRQPMGARQRCLVHSDIDRRTQPSGARRRRRRRRRPPADGARPVARGNHLWLAVDGTLPTPPRLIFFQYVPVAHRADVSGTRLCSPVFTNRKFPLRLVRCR